MSHQVRHEVCGRLSKVIHIRKSFFLKQHLVSAAQQGSIRTFGPTKTLQLVFKIHFFRRMTWILSAIT